MADPTPEQAVEAFQFMEGAAKVSAQYDVSRQKWEAIMQVPRRSVIRRAGYHDDAWAAILSAKTAFIDAQIDQARRGLPRIIAALQTGTFNVRSRMVSTPEGDVVKFDVVQNGSLTSIVGRDSWLQAAVEAADLFNL
jgi:hypothetical protein